MKTERKERRHRFLFVALDGHLSHLHRAGVLRPALQVQSSIALFISLGFSSQHVELPGAFGALNAARRTVTCLSVTPGNIIVGAWWPTRTFGSLGKQQQQLRQEQQEQEQQQHCVFKNVNG